MTAISCPNRVWVTALGSVSMALVTPKMLPVITLMSANASTAAKAPPARSFAQLPPMATANRICRLLMTAQPMFSIVVPMVMTAAMSPPPICTSLPRLIIRPAAGMTAMTVIRTLPSFCKKSKLMSPFLGAVCVVAMMFLLVLLHLIMQVLHYSCIKLRNKNSSLSQILQEFFELQSVFLHLVHCRKRFLLKMSSPCSNTVA